LKAVSSSFTKLTQGLPPVDDIERNGLNGPPNPLRGQARQQPQESELDEIIDTLERLQQQQALLERQAADDIARLEAVYQSESAPQAVERNPVYRMVVVSWWKSSARHANGQR